MFAQLDSPDCRRPFNLLRWRLDYSGDEGTKKRHHPGRRISRNHRILGFAIIGFFRKAPEISGAKKFDVHFTVPIEADKNSASWR